VSERPALRGLPLEEPFSDALAHQPRLLPHRAGGKPLLYCFRPRNPCICSRTGTREVSLLVTCDEIRILHSPEDCRNALSQNVAPLDEPLANPPLVLAKQFAASHRDRKEAA